MMMGAGLLLMVGAFFLPALILVGLILWVYKQGRGVPSAHPQQRQEVLPAVQPAGCDHCGAAMQRDWSHCPRCGAPAHTKK